MFPQAILKHLLIKKTRQLASFDKAKTEAISYVMSFIEADSGENGKPKPEKLEEKFLNMIKSIDFSE